MRLPWVTREHHEEVVRSLEAQIAGLKDQLSTERKDHLEERRETLRSTALLTHRAIKALEPKTAAAPRRQEKEKQPAKPELTTLDLAEMDPDNLPAIAEVVKREMRGYGRVNAYAVESRIEQIRDQIRSAKKHRLQQSAQPVIVPASREVPRSVEEMIQNAVNVGTAMAKQETR